MYHEFSDSYSFKSWEAFIGTNKEDYWVFYNDALSLMTAKYTTARMKKKRTTTANVFYQSTICKDNPTSKPMLTAPSEKLLRICLGTVHGSKMCIYPHICTSPWRITWWNTRMVDSQKASLMFSLQILGPMIIVESSIWRLEVSPRVSASFGISTKFLNQWKWCGNMRE